VTVAVRRVGPEAAGDVLAVVRAAFGARPTLDPPADATADTEETIAADLAADGGLLATLDGRPVGALLLKRLPEALYLRRFGVVPDAQGYGVAAALVEAAVVAAIGHEAVGVLAREELPATIAFWERHGFEEVDRRSPYVEMRRALPTSYDAPDADAMRGLGTRVGAALWAGDLVVLTGELGAGKTTFTQGLGEGLGVRGGVTSPTFVIARVHPSLGDGPDLVHVDAYRLGGIDELDDLDLDTSLDTAVTVVEWGAGLAETLSEQRLDVTITRALADDVGTDDADPRRVELRRVL
jgi:tRNA threonylcarbamoyladenosine biosynthesis protein TsaE